ncbi:MAG: glutamate 5-kinase, partial [Planctomycetes bacterium]|nr:glutamate 5-kinase [Planctomycetota bacterium]
MPESSDRKQLFAGVRRMVVKIGTSAICGDGGRLNRRAVTKLAGEIAAVRKTGVSVALISSGAIGAGMAELDMRRRPRTLPMLQAAAAAGQGQLIRVFHDAFARRDIKTAQVLVTRDAFEDRSRYLNIRNTLMALDECSALPIINENDAVCIEEIKYGDNDVIAAHVTNMLSAELLVLLTVVDGVLERGKPLDIIKQVDKEILAMVDSGKSKLGSGGMASKLQAARMVARAGEPVVIANAAEPRVLQRLLAGQRVGTVIAASGPKMSSRRRWIGQA